MVEVAPLCCVNPRACSQPSYPGCVKWLVTPQCTWGSGRVPHCHTSVCVCVLARGLLDNC